VPWLPVAVASLMGLPLALRRVPGGGAPCLSFHVSTSDQDADLAADVLRRHIASSHPAAP
jgi:hypothetical protein